MEAAVGLWGGVTAAEAGAECAGREGLVTLPGPIMTSFPQNTAVGSTSSAAVGTELSVQGQPISGGFGGFGYGLGYGRGFGYGLGGLGCYGRRGGYIC